MMLSGVVDIKQIPFDFSGEAENQDIITTISTWNDGTPYSNIMFFDKEKELVYVWVGIDNSSLTYKIENLKNQTTSEPIIITFPAVESDSPYGAKLYPMISEDPNEISFIYFSYITFNSSTNTYKYHLLRYVINPNGNNYSEECDVITFNNVTHSGWGIEGYYLMYDNGILYYGAGYSNTISAGVNKTHYTCKSYEHNTGEATYIVNDYVTNYGMRIKLFGNYLIGFTDSAPLNVVDVLTGDTLSVNKSAHFSSTVFHSYSSMIQCLQDNLLQVSNELWLIGASNIITETENNDTKYYTYIVMYNGIENILEEIKFEVKDSYSYITPLATNIPNVLCLASRNNCSYIYNISTEASSKINNNLFSCQTSIDKLYININNNKLESIKMNYNCEKYECYNYQILTPTYGTSDIDAIIYNNLKDYYINGSILINNLNPNPIIEIPDFEDTMRCAIVGNAQYSIELPKIYGLDWNSVSTSCKVKLKLHNEDEWHYSWYWEDDEGNEYYLPNVSTDGENNSCIYYSEELDGYIFNFTLDTDVGPVYLTTDDTLMIDVNIITAEGNLFHRTISVELYEPDSIDYGIILLKANGDEFESGDVKPTATLGDKSVKILDGTMKGRSYWISQNINTDNIQLSVDYDNTITTINLPVTSLLQQHIYHYQVNLALDGTHHSISIE